jgi:uncharacterized protein YjbI with pentapeptide repeats
MWCYLSLICTTPVPPKFFQTTEYSCFLSGACLRHADLKRTKLTWADLSGSDLFTAYLYESNLNHAHLRSTILNLAYLDFSDLSDAHLIEVNLNEAHFFGTNFTKAHIGSCAFGNVDLSNIEGLETIHHYGPSFLDINTIYKSKGQIPEVFLRGCGVPENFIQYMSSLIGKAFEYYSCFISYSSKDQDFAERLHADLQNKGARCWYAPKDMKIGDKIRDRIDQSIQIHDKLLLVLSEHSINSEWVDDEVEAAYEQERKRGKTVLFPIRMDSAVMDTDKAWAAKLKRSRHIGDFTQWKDHDAYQKAFDRLMRDLKAEEPAGND